MKNCIFYVSLISLLTISAMEKNPIELQGPTEDLRGPYAVHNVAWSPHNNLLAIGKSDGTVQIVSFDGSKLFLKLDNLGVGDIAWHPDGTTLATTHNQFCTIWNAVTGEKINVLADNNHEPIASVSWTHDGKLLMVREGSKQAKIQEPYHSALQQLLTHEHPITTVACRFECTDQKPSIATADAHNILVWTTRGNHVASIPTQEDHVAQLAWNGESLVASYLQGNGPHAGKITVFDSTTGQKLTTLLNTHLMTCSSNGKFVLVGYPDGRFVRKSKSSALSTARLPKENTSNPWQKVGPISSCAVSNEGSIAIARGNTTYVWQQPSASTNPHTTPAENIYGSSPDELCSACELTSYALGSVATLLYLLSLANG